MSFTAMFSSMGRRKSGTSLPSTPASPPSLPKHHSGISANILNYDVEVVEGRTTVLYNVHVHSTKSGSQWRVRRRYSEFRENFMQMKAAYPLSKVASFTFPRRTLLGGDICAEERKVALEAYLDDLLVQSPPPPLVANFLRITPERYAMSPGAQEDKESGAAVRQQQEQLSSSAKQHGDSRSPSLGSPDEDDFAASPLRFTSEDVLDSPPRSPAPPPSAPTPLRPAAAVDEDAPATPVRSSHIRVSSHHTITTATATASATASATATVSASVGAPVVANSSTTRSLYSLKVADSDDEPDEDGGEEEHHYAISPSELTRLVLMASGLCALKAGLTLLRLHMRGELDAVRIMQWLWQAAVRSRDDVLLVLKTTIFLTVLFAFAHRLIGFALGVWLRGMLQTPKGGFSMYFGWVSLRLGLDHNELVVSDFVWRNPPKFKHTPHFLKVHKLYLSFDARSLLAALWRESDTLHVHSLRLEGVEVFMERAKKRRGVEGSDGLNLWAALGADNDKKSEQVQSSVKAGMDQAAKGMGEGLAAVGESMAAGMGTAAKGVAGGAKAVGKGFMKYNPVSVLARQFSASSSSSKVGDQAAKNVSGHTTQEEAQGAGEGEGVGEGDGDGEGDGEDGTFHEAGADDEPLTPRAQSERDEEPWRDADSEKVVAAAAAEPKPRARSFFSFRGSGKKDAAVAKKEEKTSAWGVPFKIEADRFTGRNLVFHVQDFLNKSHAEVKPIVIPLMDMDRREMTVRGVRGGYRQGVWMDEFVWKIVNRLINDLLKTNSLSLIATVAASGVNNAVTGTAELAHVGLTTAEESIYSYNPKDLITGVGRGLSRLVHTSSRRARSASVEGLGVTSLRVRLIALKDLIYPHTGKAVKSMVSVKLQLDKQVACGVAVGDERKFKSKAHSDGGWGEDDGIIEYDEVFELDDVCTMAAELHLRVFESSVIKDQMLGELYLPLREDLSLTASPTYICKDVGTEDVGWYMLYGRQRSGDEQLVVGKVQLGLTLY